MACVIVSDPSTWVCETPKLTEDDAEDLLIKLYGFKATSVEKMSSDRDKVCHVKVDSSHDNPHVDNVCSHGYILKVVNSLDTQSGIVGNTVVHCILMHILGSNKTYI